MKNILPKTPFDADKAIQGQYRHYKGKNYRVLGKALHSETNEELIVYQALYGDYGVWVRPTAMFFETVQVNGSAHPRFTKTDGEQQ
jgi:hypothetical protein